MVKLADVISVAEWIEVLAELEKENLIHGDHVLDFYELFTSLKKMEPVDNSLRIIIRRSLYPLVDYEEETGLEDIEVIARDGTLNQDLENFKFLKNSDDPAFARAETDFDIVLAPRPLWLGMDIDMETLEERSIPNITAYCLYYMILAGFEERYHEMEREQTRKQYNELKKMTFEQRKKESKRWRELMVVCEKHLYVWDRG